MNDPLQTLGDFIMSWLDPLGVVIGLEIAIPVFWATTPP